MSVVALALVLLAGQSGDTRIGSRLDPATRRVHNADMGNTEASLFRFTECIVALSESRARKFLDARTVADMEAAAAVFDQSARASRCKNAGTVPGNAALVGYSTDPSTQRGMVAEAFIRKYPKHVNLAPAVAQVSYARGWHAMTGRPGAIDEMATCVAHLNPAGIVALTRTEYAGKKQTKALELLTPYFGTCLQAGFKMNTNALGIRTALTEALYHRAFDAAEQPGAAQ